MIKIEVRKGDAVVFDSVCTTSDCTLGREPGNFCVLKGWAIGKRQLRLYLKDYEVHLEDKGGLAAIQVNGTAVNRFGPLKAADSIEIGEYRIRATYAFDEAKKRHLSLVHPADEEPIAADEPVMPEAPPVEPEVAPAAEAEEVDDEDRYTALESEQGLALRQRIHRRLIDVMDLRRVNVARMDDGELRETVRRLIDEIIDGEPIFQSFEGSRTLLRDSVLNEVVGLGPLEDLIDDPSVTEIMVNRADEIFVERNGKLIRSNDHVHERRRRARGHRAHRRAARPAHRRELADGRRAAEGRLARQRDHPAARAEGAVAHDPEVLQEAADARGPDRLRLDDARDGRVSELAVEQRAEHRHLRRHGLGQDDAAQRAVQLHPGRRAHRHHRGRGRAPARPAAPGVARDAARRTWKARAHIPIRDLREERAADAPGPHRRRRVPRRRGARHAAGDEHRPRRLAHHGARQHAARRLVAPRDAGADGRLDLPATRDPRADRSAINIIVQQTRFSCGSRKSRTSPKSPAWRAT